MRIAQVAPLFESVPPRNYGGTERVVSYLTEELVRMGHDVTLFASGDSSTHARLISRTPCALRGKAVSSGGGATDDVVAPHIVQMDDVIKAASEFDVVHFHNGFLHFPIGRMLSVPHITTLHGRLDVPALQPLFDAFRDEPVVSISNAQRQPIDAANWLGTVHHGLPPDLYRPRTAPGRYLAFLGRISPEKRVDRAINIAERVGMELRIAAKIDEADTRYYEERIRPMLQGSRVRFVGEIGESEKSDFLGNAAALLFPIEWPEPFGLVMVEALACGTPVIAFRRGSVPEILDDGETGFIVDSVDGAVAAVQRLHMIDRAHCRRVFERRFLAQRMAEDYLAIYRKLTWNQDAAAA